VPSVPPPEKPATTPTLETLTAKTVLYRIHPTTFGATAFNPKLTHRYFGGGRFDATDDDAYGYMYVGDTDLCAVAETLLRDLPIDATGAITVPWVAIENRRLSAVELQEPLPLVTLVGLEALRRSSQDTWLVQTDPPEYPRTRHWGHWIRSQAPGAAGFVWPSKRDPTRRSYILFADRVPDGALKDVSHTLAGTASDPFSTPSGLAALRVALATFNANVEGPSSRGGMAR
jgi:hypothetical protein